MGWSEVGVSILLGIASSLLAKPLFYGVGGLVMMLFTDVPNVAGLWRTSYREPLGEGPTVASISEELELHQFGRLVWGKGTISGSAGRREFRYSGRIKRNVFLAQYTGPSRSGSIGSGAVQVRINERADALAGWCIWHDKDTERVEASEYTAIRSGVAA